MTNSLLSAFRRRRWDLLILGALIALGSTVSYYSAQRIDPLLFQAGIGDDVWFQSDLPRVYDNMTSRGSDHYRTKVHPLFPLMTLPAVGFLWKVLGVQPVKALSLLFATIAGFWIGAFYLLLRLSALRHLDAVVFSCVAMVSAASLFWFAVPETYSLGSLTILVALILVAMTERRRFSEAWYIAISAATLSVTVTNWMAGIIASATNLPWRRAVQVSVNAFFVVSVLWAVQKHFVPSANYFLEQGEEFRYMMLPQSGGPLRIMAAFFLHTLVAPSIEIINYIANPLKPTARLVMSVQNVLPGTGNALGLVAVLSWMALLVLGVVGILSMRNNFRLRIVIALTLASQLSLHLVYGEETFLYAMHFLPLLVLLSAFGTQTRFRWLVLSLATVFVLVAVPHNWSQFLRATKFFQSHAIKGRSDVLREMVTRPRDFWPRGQGHVVLAEPGSAEEQKSYHEPGGSFSPTVGSFGVSLWVKDRYDDIQATSNNISMNAIRQRFDWGLSENGARPPAIITDTPFYIARWSHVSKSTSVLDLRKKAGSDKNLAIAIRGVGPAGGPVNTLDWDGQLLTVNNRWQITIHPVPMAVHLGNERVEGWPMASARGNHMESSSGWGFARIDLGNENAWQMTILDANHSPANDTRYQFSDAITLDIPDQQFKESLQAQIVHLMMSLVGNQTRTADPVNTPVPWQRSGAYIIAALARAGETVTARELSQYLAENDFYGGFGAEADAPGLAIWALRQVSAHLNDAAYDKWLWPHVRRKSDLIMTMLSTKEPVRREPLMPIVPRLAHHPENDLVADAARDGLIIGRMDYHRPVLYVNAVSYRGLVDAAWLAERVGERELAAVWRERAQRLSRDWAAAFRPPESENDRTYITALWPTWVGAPLRDTIRVNLERRWGERRDHRGEYRWQPLWTHFELAEAHQWLYLRNHARTWATLNWFWEHQASPGLYTWWEDETEGNSYLGWTRIRGWVSPPHVTPHYWTSAEMLLLQLDMLAYVDESGHEPALVIGAGVPSDWTTAPMSVGGVGTSLGFVSWTWRDGAMSVVIRGGPTRKARVRLGETFPAGASLRVQYRP
jgi:hypothetical protein